MRLAGRSRPQPITCSLLTVTESRCSFDRHPEWVKPGKDALSRYSGWLRQLKLWDQPERPPPMLGSGARHHDVDAGIAVWQDDFRLFDGTEYPSARSPFPNPDDPPGTVPGQVCFRKDIEAAEKASGKPAGHSFASLSPLQSVRAKSEAFCPRTPSLNVPWPTRRIIARSSASVSLSAPSVRSRSRGRSSFGQFLMRSDFIALSYAVRGRAAIPLSIPC